MRVILPFFHCKLMHNFPSYHRDAPIGRTLLPWSTGIYLETQGDYTRACYHVDLNWEKTWLWVFFVFQSSFMLFFLLFLCSSFYLFLMNKHPRGKSGLAVLSLVKNFAEAVPAGAFCVVSHTERASGDECCWGGGVAQDASYTNWRVFDDISTNKARSIFNYGTPQNQ